MKRLIPIILILLLSGCVTARYTASEANGEDFKLTSFFKSVDGLYTERSPGEFSLKIDKTHTQDPVANMLDILRLIQGLQPTGEDDNE